MASEIFVRAILAYTVLFLLTRLMGKREISQLTYFDYVVGITIGTLTGSMIFDTKKDFQDMVPAIIVFASFQIIISYLSLKNQSLRRIFSGSNTVLIENGKILEENMYKSRINIDELSGKLREKNVFKLTDVEYAFLETNGKVSVMKKAGKRAVTLDDLNIKPVYTGIGRLLIEEGIMNLDVLRKNNLTKAWLMDKLKKQGIDDIKKVMFCQVDEAGNVFVDKYDDKE